MPEQISWIILRLMAVFLTVAGLISVKHLYKIRKNQDTNVEKVLYFLQLTGSILIILVGLISAIYLKIVLSYIISFVTRMVQSWWGGLFWIILSVSVLIWSYKERKDPDATNSGYYIMGWFAAIAGIILGIFIICQNIMEYR